MYKCKYLEENKKRRSFNIMLFAVMKIKLSRFFSTGLYKQLENKFNAPFYETRTYKHT